MDERGNTMESDTIKALAENTWERATTLHVDAEFIIRHRETGKEENLEVKGLECVWHWDDGTRDATEYWAVVDWIGQTFGNSVDWFSVKSWTGSPKKEEG